MDAIEKKELIEGGRLIHAFIREIRGLSYIPITEGLALELYTDWNSLMGVVGRIESLKLGDLKGLIEDESGNEDEHFNCVAGIEIRGSYCNIYIQANMRLVDNFIETNMKDKFSATYKAVVEFIKWYNKKNK